MKKSKLFLIVIHLLRTEYCEYTDKNKELISFKVIETPHGNCKKEPWGGDNTYNLDTGFALRLGYNWHLWQAYREIKFG